MARESCFKEAANLERFRVHLKSMQECWVIRKWILLSPFLSLIKSTFGSSEF